jgi:hypothetical protein
MKCFVRDDPLTWAIVCLAASTVAEKTSPDAFGIYLTALGVAAAALVHILFPKALKRYVQAGQGHGEGGEGSAH